MSYVRGPGGPMPATASTAQPAPFRACHCGNRRYHAQRRSACTRAERRQRSVTSRVADDPYYDRYRRSSDYPPRPEYPPPPEHPPSAQTRYEEPPGGPPPGSNNDGNGEWRNRALLAGAFVLGLGAGVWFTEDVNLYPNNVASTELVDRRTPNSEVCMSNGYSAMVFDQRIFVSFNPFNVYVTQPEVKPGCVLRRSNYNVLEKRKLVNQDETESCKRGMNTFAYVGDLEGSPEVSCVYHSEQAENQYLENPQRARMGDGRRPMDAPATPVP